MAMTKERAREIIEYSHLSAADAALTLGYSDSGSYGKALKRAKELMIEEAKTLNQRVVESGLKTRNNELSAMLKEAEKAIHMRDRQIAEFIGLQSDPPKAPKWLANKATKQEEPGVPFFLWSDWHLGESVDPAQVYGVNEFNQTVAAERVQRLVSRSIFLATEHRRFANTSGGAVIILGGDFVSGWQHEELVATDYCTPLQAVREATGLLTWALEKMREVFGNIVVVCVAGNHGRLTRKPMAKMSAYAAYDWLIYGFLQDSLGKQRGYTFRVPATNNDLLKVGRTNYLIQHGHELGVKGGDGIIGALGPIMRGRAKAGRANSAIGRQFDVLVLGHFHQHLWLPTQGLIVNNTLKGYDEYSKRENYVASAPSQTMWWEHPRLGPTAPLEVFVDDPRRAK